MKYLSIKWVLFLNYLIFAILLSSVGTVILQMQRNFDVTKSNAAILEMFKDFPIAITSFLVASYLPKFGLKKAMLYSLSLTIITCILMPFSNAFWCFKLMFVVFGSSFAIIKVSVFATIGLVTNNAKEHGSFMNTLEAIFMAGVLLGNILISLLINNANPKSRDWLFIYWIVALISLCNLWLLYSSKLDEPNSNIGKSTKKNILKETYFLVIKTITIVFIISIFFYVMLEQSLTSWFPTFYKEVLHAPTSMSIQAGAILAGALFLGRLLSSLVLLRIKWIYFLTFCLVMVAITILFLLSISKNPQNESISWNNAPLVLYLFPFIGFFLAPIYPTLNSIILSSLPKDKHSSMSGLIVVFSALGGSLGSILTGYVFENFNGKIAFYFTLIPIFVIIALLFILYSITNNKLNLD